MKVYIAFPVPMDSIEVWNVFKPEVERFCSTMRQFHPGTPYTIAAIINEKEELVGKSQLFRMFERLPVEFHLYSGTGCDVGSAQYFASLQSENCFLICCTSRIYAHREGWLKKLVEARLRYGEGLYTTAISRERNRLHACCRCYCMDSDRFNAWPKTIEHRPDGYLFESGEYMGLGGSQTAPQNLLEWFNAQRLPTRVVYWSGCHEIGDGTEAMEPDNIFRKGDQSNMLIHDRISRFYEQSDESGKNCAWQACRYGK
jgi:hypothetical protein